MVFKFDDLYGSHRSIGIYYFAFACTLRMGCNAFLAGYSNTIIQLLLFDNLDKL